MSSTAKSGDVGPLTVIYDGGCPFCSRFVALYRIRRNVGRVDLIDARDRPDLVEDLGRDGIDIDDGMVVEWNGRRYFGPDSVNLLAMLGAEKGAFSAINRLMFKNAAAARFIYPVLVRGRKLSLKLLGRTLINGERGIGA